MNTIPQVFGTTVPQRKASHIDRPHANGADDYSFDLSGKVGAGGGLAARLVFGDAAALARTTSLPSAVASAESPEGRVARRLDSCVASSVAEDAVADDSAAAGTSALDEARAGYVPPVPGVHREDEGEDDAVVRGIVDEVNAFIAKVEAGEIVPPPIGPCRPRSTRLLPNNKPTAVRGRPLEDMEGL